MSFSNFSLDNLKFVSYCPLCNSAYNPLEAKILEERDDAHLVHVRCRNCQSAIVALIVSGGLGVSSIGLVTDLSAEDVVHFKNEEPITIDDVLALHEELKQRRF